MACSDWRRVFIPADSRLTGWAIAMTLAGLGLRIAAARGDLWQDEIYTILLSQGIHRVDEVFWHINSDNNHMLNTLYVFLVGPSHSPLVLRLEAILFGTLSIPAAGLAAYGRRRCDTTAAAAAMMLTAIVYPAVHYGSEARGYAGMMLAGFLAFHIAEGGLRTRASQAWLGVAALFGVLSYSFTMFPLAALGLWRCIIIRLPKEDWFQALVRAAIPFWAAIMAVSVPFVLVGIGNIYHTFLHGGALSAHPHITTGKAILRFFNFSFGIPEGMAAGTGIFAALACLLVASRSSSLAVRRHAGYFALLSALYLAYLMAIGAPAGLDHARYVMLLLPPLILIMADCASIGLRLNRHIRAFAILMLAALVAGNGMELAHFYAEGRGHYADAVKMMTRDGPATFASDQQHGHADIAGFYARRLNRPLTFVPLSDTCVIPPDWLVVSSDAGRFDTLEYGPAGCTMTFTDPQVFSYWGLAGWTWTIYRRVR